MNAIPIHPAPLCKLQVIYFLCMQRTDRPLSQILKGAHFLVFKFILFIVNNYATKNFKHQEVEVLKKTFITKHTGQSYRWPWPTYAYPIYLKLG